MDAPQPILEAHGIVKAFGEGAATQVVAKEVDLTLEAGQMVALLGESGSGKSTLLNILGLLLSPDQGTLSISGQRVDGLSARRLSQQRLRRVSHVFQAFHLIDHKTVFENVELPLIHAGLPRPERVGAVGEVLRELGLEHRADAYPPTLSGGEKQRVAIGRAIITRPDVLLCDEPTGSLDSARSAEVIALLRSVTRPDSTTIIVTHEHSVAAKCDRIIRLVDGVIQHEASGPAAALSAPLVSATAETALTDVIEAGPELSPDSASAPQAHLPGPAIPRRRSPWGRIAFREAWNAFAGRLRRNLFTLVGVALGVSALVLSVGFATTVSEQLSARFDAFLADRLTVTWKSTEEASAAAALDWNTSSDAEQVRSINGVLETAVVQRLDVATEAHATLGDFSKPTSVSVASTSPEGLGLLGVQIKQGRAFDSGHSERQEPVALVNERVLKALGLEWTPGLDLSVGHERVNVIGVVEFLGDSRGAYADVYLPLGSKVPGGDVKTAMLVKVRPGAADVVAPQVPVALDPNQPQKVSVSSPPEPKSLRQAVDGQQQALTVGMSVLTLVIAGIGIMNTFVVAVMERRREIGIRMALGAPPGAIAAQFTWEAVLTALAGSMVGVLFSVNALFIIAAVNAWTPVLSPLTVGLGLGAGLIVGTLAGIMPAIKAARIEPVETLQQ